MSSISFYDQLVINLEEIIKAHRSLLLVVRSEKEILVAANLDDLNENNKLKEDVLINIKKLEQSRKDIVRRLIA